MQKRGHRQEADAHIEGDPQISRLLPCKKKIVVAFNGGREEGQKGQAKVLPSDGAAGLI